MLLQACVLALLGASVQGYIFQNVASPDEYSPDTVYLQTSTGTYGCCGYVDSAFGRFSQGSNRCYIPFEGEEFEVVLPYDVLVREPFREFLFWTFIYTADEIRSNGVRVCENCVGGSDMYICASQDRGPGKLIVGDDNSVACYVSYDGTEHVFTDGYTTLSSQDAADYGLSDVNYYLDDLELLENEPLALAEATVENNQDSQQTITRILEYSVTSSSEWGNAYGFIIGLGMSVSAGIPLFGDFGWEISVEESFEYNYGESFSETLTTSTEATLTVPPKSSCRVSIIAREMECDVPYDATTTIYYFDGTQETAFISGVYNGVSVNSDQVIYDECIPLD